MTYQLVVPDAITSKFYMRLVDILQKLPLDEPLLLIINSFGGEVHAALAIYDYLINEQLKGRVIMTMASGVCMSAGTILLAASNVRYATPNTSFMIHYSHGGYVGDGSVKSLLNELSYSTHIDKLCTDIVTRHAHKKHIKNIFKMIDDKTDLYFGAEQAKTWGFITDIGFPEIRNISSQVVINSFEVSDDE